MTVLRTRQELRRRLASLRSSASSVSFVPTMGALHAGHIALFEAARDGDRLVVSSIFVNPAQFTEASDLEGYPRQEAADIDAARAAGVDIVFLPAVADMYPEGFRTRVAVTGAAEGYEGASRAGHFDGVATVCLKLFNIVQPDEAFFGQKDAQQVAVIRQMVRDLDLDLEILVVPTVREADGLALSSRNVRLSPADREAAQAIPRALAAGLDAHQHGGDVAAAARAALASSRLDVEYVEVATFDSAPTLVVAARAGKTRLIDNVPLDRPELAGLPSTAAPVARAGRREG